MPDFNKQFYQPQTFLLAEHFYSPQCEGNTTGVNAYFIRVAGCNLSCGASRDTVREIRKTDPNEIYDKWSFDGPEDGKKHPGDLEKSGQATWTCDTILEWLHGNRTSFQDLVDSWDELGITDWVRQQITHLIFTGGEPGVKRQQRAWMDFVDFLEKEHNIVPFTEIETNGTQYLDQDFFEHLGQINCSPKLANSGMAKERRLIPQAIERIMEHPNYWFKFVVSGEDDVKEYIKDYVEPFNIPTKRVCMMPAEDRVDYFHENTRMVLELTKKYGFRGLQRMHVSAWDQTTGV